MKQILKKGSTSKRLLVFIADSASTTGAGLTGLAYNTSGLVWYYWREDAGNSGGTAVTIVTATRGTFTSGGFKEVDATNLPGVYEIGIPNAVLASGASWAFMYLKGAASMAPLPIEIQLVNYDPDDGNLGLTGLTGLTAPTAGALPTVGSSSGQISLSSGYVSPVQNHVGTAQAGAATTITLASVASSTDNIYNNTTIYLTGGTGAGQSAGITDYNGTTKVATIEHTWLINPDNTTTYEIHRDRLGGDVANVSGKVLGGGTKPITGVGVRAYDASGNAIAPAATALSTADWTTARAGYLDNISAGAVALASTALSTANWTTARAGYLDKLNISGNVAGSSEVTSIQNNTSCVRSVPTIIERPDSGTVTYRIELLLYDEVGNMEAPDADPTISLVNQSGTDLSARLDSTTMSNVSTGRYRAIYTASDTDTLEQLVWTFSVVEGGATRLYGNTTLIVDTTAVDFTSSDRTKLNQLATDYTTARAGKLDYLTGNVALASGVTVTTNNDKTGYGLADGAITEAKFTLPTLGAHTLATGPLGMIMQTWRADHYVEKFDSASGDLKRYASDGTTVLLVLPCSDTTGVQTRGAAS